ncbi:glycoside hydrolase family 97 protein [Maribellus maritimus]|uniref:glycoside hydrolase family 97 protein n=1 Tax=Maribellus maritimus TaxID=2870838 RepID=UPI001EEBE312|nr:glycoside hydrolase family 97 protein [Maribellus maritimus]MCG6191077.1 glycoside hydrolase family 97 protein [Maribellus maritimus]
MPKKFNLTFLFFLILTIGFAEEYNLHSPDKKISVGITIDKNISYSISFNGERIINPSEISFVFKQAPPLGQEMNLLSTEEYSSDKYWKPVLKRFETIHDHHRGIVFHLQEKNFPQRLMDIEFRIFDDGVAFRTSFPKQFGEREFVITDELCEFSFTENHTCWAENCGYYITSQEIEFFERKIKDITPDMIIGLPFTVKVNDKCYAAISEAALTDYAGMYLKSRTGEKQFSVRTALSPLKGQTERGDKVNFKTPHQTPWRVIMIGETPGSLVESEIIQNLNEPCEIEDPSWIKPGLSAWDHWWSAEVKMEQPVIYEYIDLASSMGWPYMLIDWQWYGMYNEEGADIKTTAPQLNMSEILAYAKEKNVKCWLWMHNTDVFRLDFEEACALYEEWGIAGIKIDFMNSDDQEMVNWYHKVVKMAAKYHLMVDFHGAYKPTGWRRTYPNLVTREGVLGNEYNKWSLRVTPEHMCTLPFTRMLAGPMDFTPGGFLNRNPDKFLNGTPANVLGTRSNTLAQFVVYDSPYLVACDHPKNYYGQTGEEFLKEVKSMWDDTRVLNGEIGKYITVVRRDGRRWFIGAMNNSHERELEVSLDFLSEEKYTMTSFSDLEKTKENAEIAEKKKSIVDRSSTIKIKMVPGGGFAAWLELVQ